MQMEQRIPFFQLCCLAVGFSLCSLGCLAQKNNHIAVLGKWVNDEQGVVIDIYQEGKAIFGKISWVKNENATTDLHNTNASLRTRPLKGIDMLANFVYNHNQQTWQNGILYDYHNGRDYSCQLWFEEGNDQTLFIRTYIGLPVLGTTTTWTRPTTNHPVYAPRYTSAR